MQLKSILLATTVSIFALPALVQAAPLSGQVSSAEEGNMEGVVVSAKKEGSTVTVSVPMLRMRNCPTPMGSPTRIRNLVGSPFPNTSGRF